MSDKLSRNLNILMEEMRINAEELSRRIGLPASTIKKVRNNIDANPTVSTLQPIAKYFSLSISQLIGDEPFPSTRFKGSYVTNTNLPSQVPIISWDEAINWPNVTTSRKIMVSTEFNINENAYGLSVEEEDWENLRKGTTLIVDPSLDPENRDLIIVHRYGQIKPTLRQLLIDDGHMYLKPVRLGGYIISEITPEHKILGVVTEYKKHLRN